MSNEYYVKRQLPAGWPLKDYTPEQKESERCYAGADGMAHLASDQDRLNSRCPPRTFLEACLAKEGVFQGKTNNGHTTDYLVSADDSLEVRHEKTNRLLQDVRVTAGCKPGESLTERVRMLREHYEGTHVRGSHTAIDERMEKIASEAMKAIDCGDAFKSARYASEQSSPLAVELNPRPQPESWRDRPPLL